MSDETTQPEPQPQPEPPAPSTEGERDQGKPLTTKVDSMEEAEGWTQPEATNRPTAVPSEEERSAERNA